MTLTMSTQKHIPVLLDEVTEALNISPGKRYVDCTLGLGGHALSILEKGLNTVQLLGIDADTEAIEIAKDKLDLEITAVTIPEVNISKVEEIANQIGVKLRARQYIPNFL